MRSDGFSISHTVTSNLLIPFPVESSVSISIGIVREIIGNVPSLTFLRSPSTSSGALLLIIIPCLYLLLCSGVLIVNASTNAYLGKSGGHKFSTTDTESDITATNTANSGITFAIVAELNGLLVAVILEQEVASFSIMFISPFVSHFPLLFLWFTICLSSFVNQTRSHTSEPTEESTSSSSPPHTDRRYCSSVLLQKPSSHCGCNKLPSIGPLTNATLSGRCTLL
mmetsp:Transcript_32449/g.58644  ORF Transcript_32449/g.58644 Transcript_32449/m.58644 type:complete len:225 (-) Transcript_32449:1649-2323(-)